MNIAIIVLGIVDAILIYIIDIITEDVLGEIVIDISLTLLFALGGNHILNENDEYEKALKLFKWMVFLWLIVALCGIVLAIIKKDLMHVQTNFSIVIPLTIAYFILVIKNKIEEDSWRLK